MWPSLGENCSVASPRPALPAAVALTVGAKALQAEEIPVPNAAVGLLYDASICIGCKACVAACAEANDTPPDTRRDTLHQAPTDLNDLTRNVIKLYKAEDGSAFSYVKRQCMHCLDPACAAGCPFQALHKDQGERHRQVGCRQVYRVPLLHHHLSLSHSAFPVAGIQPARDQVRAVQPPFGARAEAGMYQCLSHWRCHLRSAHSLAAAMAKQRIKNDPGRYYQGPRVWRNRQRRNASSLSVSCGV